MLFLFILFCSWALRLELSPRSLEEGSVTYWQQLQALADIAADNFRTVKWYWETVGDELRELCPIYGVEQLYTANRRMETKVRNELQRMKLEKFRPHFTDVAWIARVKAIKSALGAMEALRESYGVCSPHFFIAKYSVV